MRSNESTGGGGQRPERPQGRRCSGAGGGQDERRSFGRFPVSCPVVLCGLDGEPLLRSRTRNVSDGGCYFLVESDRAIGPQGEFTLDLKVARQTCNTYMLEPFRIAARVVRVEEPVGESAVERGVAMAFVKPVELQLE